MQPTVPPSRPRKEEFTGGVCLMPKALEDDDRMPGEKKTTKRRAATRELAARSSAGRPAVPRRVRGRVVSATGAPVLNLKLTACSISSAGLLNDRMNGSPRYFR